jgi:hypothetical protein
MEARREILIFAFVYSKTIVGYRYIVEILLVGRRLSTQLIFGFAQVFAKDTVYVDFQLKVEISKKKFCFGGCFYFSY